MDLISVLIFVFTTLLVALVLKKALRTPDAPSKFQDYPLPPGPTGLPFVGNFYDVVNPNRDAAMKKFLQWGREYGDVCMVNVGTLKFILFSSLEALKESFVDQPDHFSDRYSNSLIRKYGIDTGVVMSNGRIWKKNRKFVHGILRKFGIGSKKMEELITGEIKYLLADLEELEVKPVDLTNNVEKVIVNIISLVVFGHRFDFNDPEFMKFFAELQIMIERSGDRSFMAMPDWVNSVGARMFNSQVKEFMKTWEICETFIMKELDEHKSRLDEENPYDLIDHFITGSKSSDNESVENKKLINIVQEIFTAGSETTLTTLHWFILYMIKHPEYQEKVQHELDTVIGHDRSATMADQDNCPYTEACTMEALRLGTTVPTTLEHTVTEECLVKGFRIPKGAQTYSVIYTMNRDENLWKTVNEFDPENFLDSEGALRKIPEFTPFGIGPRICVGERMARMEMWLIVASLLQKYNIKLPAGHSAPDETPQTGLTLKPARFDVVLEPRVLLHH